jgi:MFS family permease
VGTSTNNSIDSNDQQDGRVDQTNNAQFTSYIFSAAVADAVLPIFYIFIPLYAVAIGANPLELGLVGGASYAVYSFMPFIMGHFSDRSGSRKFFILTSFVLLGMVSFLYSLTTSPITLILIRLVEGTGWAMLWPAIEAAIIENPSREPRKSLSIFNYTWSGGAMLGPPIGTLLVTTFSYGVTFVVSGALFAILIALNSWTLIRKGPRLFASQSVPAEKETKSHVSMLFSIRKVLLPSDGKKSFRIWTSLVAMCLSALTSSVFFTFFGPYANKTIGLTLLSVGAITTTYGVVRFLTYILFAKQSTREKFFAQNTRVRNTLIFAAIASLSTLILVVRDQSGALYFLAFALFAIGYSVVYSISQVTLIAETPREHVGAGAGLFESSIGIGGLVGPIVAGAISSGTYSDSFMVPAICLVLVLALLSAISVSRKRFRI